jgi:hypothetical protein
MKITYEYLENQRLDEINERCIKMIDIDGSEKFIPLDPANSDYQKYLASLEKPETPETENN